MAVPAVVLQTLAEEWANGNWLRAILRPFTDLLGDGIFGTVLGGAIILGFWIWADDLAMPAVILFMLSGVLIAFLPGDVAGIAQAFLVLAGLSALLEAARRYVL